MTARAILPERGGSPQRDAHRRLAHDLIVTPAAVKLLRDSAETALDEGRLQDARHLIADLASEHVISVTNLPLATYPDVIKQAAVLIHADRADEAAGVLDVALGTLVVEDMIVPLPLARAAALIERARPLAEKPGRSAGENGELRQLSTDTRTQLELARGLGYATKEDLDALSDAVEELSRKTEGQGSGIGLFDRFKALFDSANRNANAKPVK